MSKWLGYLSHKPTITISSTSSGTETAIVTSRLYIRSYRETDFEYCVSLYSDSKLARYFDHGQTRTREQIEVLVRERGTYFSSNGCPYGLFSVFSRDEEHFLGQVDLLPVEEFPGILEVGVIFMRHTHNKGYGIEAAKFVGIDLANELVKRGIFIRNTPLTKIVATVHPTNYPCKRIIETVGMTFDKSQERFGQPRLWYSYKPNAQTC